MRPASSPRVSVGLPVFNGEDHLAAAISSILDQTYQDFELIICDNASTDRTQAICREFAARDGRIRYHRNPTNIGAARNFDLAWHLARGEYFKWAAHDDLLAPEFLERCVAALDADPGAVLVYTLVRQIECERDIGLYDSALEGADAASPSKRFAALVLLPHMCTEVFGLIRSRALAGTPLMASYRGSHRALLAVLALRGRVVNIAEPLFVHRDHAGRFVHGPWHERGACMAGWDPSKAGRRVWNSWTLWAELFRGARREIADARERRRCYAHLLRWPAVGDNAKSLIADLFWGLDPRIFRAARAAKRWAGAMGGRSLQPAAATAAAAVVGPGRPASPAHVAQVYSIADHLQRRHRRKPRVVVRRELAVAGIANGHRAIDQEPDPKPVQTVGDDPPMAREQAGAASHEVVRVSIPRSPKRQRVVNGTVLDVKFPKHSKRKELS